MLYNRLVSLSKGVVYGEYFQHFSAFRDAFGDAAAQYLKSLIKENKTTFRRHLDCDLKEVWNTMLDLAKK
jgi:hypothetical protein